MFRFWKVGMQATLIGVGEMVYEVGVYFVFVFFRFGLIVLSILIFMSFMCELVGGSVVGRETDTLAGAACINTLERIIQRYSRNSSLRRDKEASLETTA